MAFVAAVAVTVSSPTRSARPLGPAPRPPPTLPGGSCLLTNTSCASTMPWTPPTPPLARRQLPAHRHAPRVDYAVDPAHPAPRPAAAACPPTRSARRLRPGSSPPRPSPVGNCLPTDTLRASNRLCTPPTSYLIIPPPLSHAERRPPPHLRIRHQCPTWVSPASGQFKKPPTHIPPTAAPCGVGRKSRPAGLTLGSGHWHPAQPPLTDRPPVSHRRTSSQVKKPPKHIPPTARPLKNFKLMCRRRKERSRCLALGPGDSLPTQTRHYPWSLSATRPRSLMAAKRVQPVWLSGPASARPSAASVLRRAGPPDKDSATILESHVNRETHTARRRSQKVCA